MKKHLFVGLLALSVWLPSWAGTYPLGSVNGSGESLNLEVPDGNPCGMVSMIDVSGAGRLLSHLTVTLNISGGYNGDLYAYVRCNGKLVVLLNRVGADSDNAFGSSDTGLRNVTLSSSGGDVHWASAGGAVLTGNFQADGRQINPLPSSAGFNAKATVTLDGSFAGENPNGTWTLFIADLSGGGINTLEGWSLDITTVPSRFMGKGGETLDANFADVSPNAIWTLIFAGLSKGANTTLAGNHWAPQQRRTMALLSV